MDFSEKVYAIVKRIPKGKISTYKDIGIALHTKAYRSIGSVLKRNPNAPHVPCHRVVASDGSIGGYMGMKSGKNIKTKIAMLQKEGITIKNNKIFDFKNVKIKF
ncbi:MAG TPA: MGMT family protein [Candidatus Nanoarchaeia archaeon]|nr:MGMT family protein [Candidatus Nanoarchaeia archaeon]